MIAYRINLHRSLFFCIVCTLLVSCSQEENPVLEPTDGTDLMAFELKASDGTLYHPFLVDDSIIHISVPNQADVSKLTPVFKHNGLKVLANNGEINSGFSILDFSDFTNPVEIKVISSLGEEKTLKVNIYDLPVLLINTPNSQPIESKEVRVEGTEVKLVDSDLNVIDLGIGGIRGRGNSTWLEPKKPYNLKLDKKQEILGMSKSKHWILLAHSNYDRTQIHNATAFEMARLTDFPWVQSGRFVELILNGTHKGIYYLCEKIRAEKGKIEIDEMSPEDETGGFLLESVMSFEPTGDFFTTDYFNLTGKLHTEPFVYTLGWEIKSPDEEDVTPLQRSYIVNSMNEMEKLIADDETAQGEIPVFSQIS